MEQCSREEQRKGAIPGGQGPEQELRMRNEGVQGSVRGYRGPTEAQLGGAKLRSLDLTLQPMGK